MRERCGRRRSGKQSKEREEISKNKYKVLQYYSTRRKCSSTVKKFTISSPDGAWFLCENAKICQDMAYGSPSANALRIVYSRAKPTNIHINK